MAPAAGVERARSPAFEADTCSSARVRKRNEPRGRPGPPKNGPNVPFAGSSSHCHGELDELHPGDMITETEVGPSAELHELECGDSVFFMGRSSSWMPIIRKMTSSASSRVRARMRRSRFVHHERTLFSMVSA